MKIFLHSILLFYLAFALTSALELINEDVDTSGKSVLQIWKIYKDDKRTALAKLDDPSSCEFKDENVAFLVLHVDTGNQKSLTAHYWLGRNAPREVKAEAAGLTADLQKVFNNDPMLIGRQLQDKEENDFKCLFPERFSKSETKPDLTLYKIKGSSIMMVPPEVKQVTKYNCYILDHGDDTYYFKGKSSTDDEQKLAKKLWNRIHTFDNNKKGNKRIVDNVAEDDANFLAFVKLLGGNKESVKVVNSIELMIDEYYDNTRWGQLYFLQFKQSWDETMKGHNGVSRTVMHQRPLVVSMLDSFESVVLGTESIAGWYVYHGKHSYLRPFKEALQRAEEDAHDDKLYKKVTILQDRLFQDRSMLPTSFLVHFKDFLYV